MAWFSKKKFIATTYEIRNLHKMLLASFSNVKGDTSKIFEWLNYLYQKNQEQDQKIQALQHQLTYAPDQKQQVKEVLDEYYSFEDTIHKIDDLNAKISQLDVSNSTLPHEIANLKLRLATIEQKKQVAATNIKEKLLRKITHNSKDYIKNLLISMVRKYGQITALQLKEMLVDEQGLCSKSSFYRILGEIEQENEVSVKKEGKEKTYFFQIAENSSLPTRK